MLKIDNSLLVEVGLGGLPDTEKNSFLKHIYETLEMRVGVRLADQMTNEQLDEFERYFEAKDDAGAFKWLETNFPNYKEIVQQEFDKLKAEVAQSAPQILATSQQAARTPAAAAGAAQPAAGQAAIPPMPAPAPGQPPVTSAPPLQATGPQPSPTPVPQPAVPPMPSPATPNPGPGSVTPTPSPEPPIQPYAADPPTLPPTPPTPPPGPNPPNPDPVPPMMPPYPQEQPPAGPGPSQ